MEQEPKITNELQSKRESIIEGEYIDKDLTFELNNEKDSAGNTIEGKHYWVKLNYRGQNAEGKLFTPQEGNDKLVVFEAGLPGDSTVWIEEKHVPYLVKNGYTVLTIKHLGTKTATDRSPLYIHCPERIEKGKEAGVFANIGEQREYTLEEIASEPSTALNAIGANFSEIFLIGHSAGSLFEAYSLPKLEAPIRKKIRNLISLAGYVGGVEERVDKFGDLKGYYEMCRKVINMGDPEQSEKMIRGIFNEVYKNGVPEHIMVTQVQSPHDEYVTESGAKKFQEFLGRGLRIIDETQFEDEFHDLKNLQPETLVRFLTMYYPKAKRSWAVRKHERNK